MLKATKERRCYKVEARTITVGLEFRTRYQTYRVIEILWAHEDMAYVIAEKCEGVYTGNRTMLKIRMVS
jgi:hypothetical protein